MRGKVGVVGSAGRGGSRTGVAAVAADPRAGDDEAEGRPTAAEALLSGRVTRFQV